MNCTSENSSQINSLWFCLDIHVGGLTVIPNVHSEWIKACSTLVQRKFYFCRDEFPLQLVYELLFCMFISRIYFNFLNLQSSMYFQKCQFSNSLAQCLQNCWNERKTFNSGHGMHTSQYSFSNTTFLQLL